MGPLAFARILDVNVAEIVTAVAAIGAAAAAVYALIYARREISTAGDTARVERTFRLYEHQLNPDFAKHIAWTSDFVTIESAVPSRELVAKFRWFRWNRMDRGRKIQILLYLNHLEAVAGLYEQDRLDEKSVMWLFGGAADSYWKRAEWFVTRVQAENPATFEKWGKLASAYRSWKQRTARQGSG